MLTFTCPICQQAFTLSRSEMPRSCTLDCPQCGGLLLYLHETLYDFHAKLHADDPRWPVDGKGTGCLTVQPDAPPETIAQAVANFRDASGRVPLSAKLLQRFEYVRQQAQQAQRCASCGQVVDLTAFRDELSRREYHLSSFCQSCQDRFFGA